MASFQNQATLTYRDSVTTSNVVTGELQQAVSMTKSTLSTTYTTDDVITYVVSIVNSGSSPITDLTLTDNLGAYSLGGTTVTPLDYVEGSLAYYVGGARQATPVVTGTNPLTVTGVAVPAADNAFLVYQATTNSFASPVAGSTINNTATLTGTALSAPVTATASVTVTSEAYLTISKALSPATVSEGDRLTYTFTIQNFGNTAVVTTDDAAITDTFDPILTDLAVTFNGTAWTQGTEYSYSESTGVFNTLPTYITVPAATYTQDATTGAWTVRPGVSTLTVVGTV